MTHVRCPRPNFSTFANSRDLDSLCAERKGRIDGDGMYCSLLLSASGSAPQLATVAYKG
jgi:hypothetical protein